MKNLPREEGDGTERLDFPIRSGDFTQNRLLLAFKPRVHYGLSQKWGRESISI